MITIEYSLNIFMGRIIFEVASVVSVDLTSNEIADMTTSEVVDSFNVDASDVTTDVDYLSTGSVEISVDDETTEIDIIAAMTSTLAEVLDIHSRDVTIVSVDLESGEVLYEIASETYEVADIIQNQMNSLSTSTLANVIETILPTAQIEAINVDDDIKVDVTIIVDGSESDNIGQANRNVEQILGDQGFDVSTDVSIVTAAPSALPTFTTLTPSPAPSMTGIIVTITLTTSDEILDSASVSSLAQELAQDYGVNVEDVIIEPTYTVSGSIEVDDLPEDISEQELQNILEDSIAGALGVYSRNIEITIDDSLNEVTYVLSSNDDTVAVDIHNMISSDTFLDDLNDEVSSLLPSITISSIDTDEQIEMELTVTIDASESTIDVEEMNAHVTSSFEDQGFSAEFESN